MIFKLLGEIFNNCVDILSNHFMDIDSIKDEWYDESDDYFLD
jgi:hypothetical protein